MQLNKESPSSIALNGLSNIELKQKKHSNRTIDRYTKQNFSKITNLFTTCS
jgi:hypothetical protein